MEKGAGALGQIKLKYTFHNPNTEAAAAEFLTRLFIESNAKKVKLAVREAASRAHESAKQNGTSSLRA